MAGRKKEVKKGVNYGAVIPGAVLILLGIIFLLNELNIIAFNFFYVTLLTGAVFIAGYLISKTWGLLIPGVIITGISLIFLFNVGDLWYLYPASVALAFLAVYATKQDNTNWALIPGGILTAVALIGSFEYYTSINTGALILIGAGIYIIYKNYKK